MSNQMPGDPVAQISGHRMDLRAPGRPDSVVDAEPPPGSSDTLRCVFHGCHISETPRILSRITRKYVKVCLYMRCWRCSHALSPSGMS